MLRRNTKSVLRLALDLEVSGKRKRGRTTKTRNKQVKEETEKVGLMTNVNLNRMIWQD